jgi:hypothetical protein
VEYHPSNVNQTRDDFLTRPLEVTDLRLWDNKTSADILADVNILLTGTWTAESEWMPGSVLIPMSTYTLLWGCPVVRLLLRKRRTRRPKRFTRKA